MFLRRVPPDWPLERRLAARSVRDPKTGCLLWTASRNRSGYGHLFWKGVPQLAHRAAWMARHGAVQRGMQWLDRVAGAMFIAFGLKLAFTDNPSR